jgi:hypothetical protein
LGLEAEFFVSSLAAAAVDDEEDDNAHHCKKAETADYGTDNESNVDGRSDRLFWSPVVAVVVRVGSIKIAAVAVVVVVDAICRVGNTIRPGSTTTRPAGGWAGI